MSANTKPTIIKNGNIITKGAIIKNASLFIKGKKISHLGKGPVSKKSYIIIDAKGCYISAGFIDTHIHGDPDKIFKREIKFGTTSIVIAKSCAGSRDIRGEAKAIEDFKARSPFGANVLGLRLEGPFISRKKAGAQDKRYIAAPDREKLLQLMEGCGKLLKMMTIAPETEGALSLIRLLSRSEVIASVGHTNASYDETVKGIDAGARHATHIFNAMRETEGSEPGASAALILDKRVVCEIILDLAHVGRSLAVIFFKIKGPGKTVLVTDSIVAGAPPGTRKEDVVYRFADGKIAGSSLTMIGAVKNAVTSCRRSIVEAVTYATRNPARVLGLEGRKGTLGAGADADIVIFDRDFDVKMTIIGGNIVYRAKGF